MNPHLHRWGPASAPKVIAIHGFADAGTAFARLGQTRLVETVELIAPDLPGFGASHPASKPPATIESLAEFILTLADTVSPDEPVMLLAHSVGSAIAVAAALRAPQRISAVVSVEGNLTADDAYFSGQAAAFDDPHAFKTHFLDHIEQQITQDEALKRYHDAATKADAKAMWSLGRDAARHGKDHGFGNAFLQLGSAGVASLYIWARHNTPPATAAYIDDHVERSALNQVELASGGHWVFDDEPAMVASLLHAFLAEAPTLNPTPSATT